MYDDFSDPVFDPAEYGDYYNDPYTASGGINGPARQRATNPDIPVYSSLSWVKWVAIGAVLVVVAGIGLMRRK